ncbi:MAG: STN domain-containing protein, partial [Bacteroides sp.]
MKKHKTRIHYPLFLGKIIVSSLLFILFVNIPLQAALAQSISLNKRNVSMISIIKEVEKMTHYKFFYNNNLVNVNGLVSVSLANASIETAVRELLRNTPYTYQIENDQVLIFASKD